MFDEYGPDAPQPQARLDEQSFQLGTARADDDHGKARDTVDALRDHDLAALDLLEGKVDGFGVCLQLLTIFGKGARCAVLQLFKVEPLVRPGQPGPDRKLSGP